MSEFLFTSLETINGEEHIRQTQCKRSDVPFMEKIDYNKHSLSAFDLSIVKSRFARFGTIEEPNAEEDGADFFVEKQTARYMAMDYASSEATTLARSDLGRIRPKREALNNQFRESELNRLDGQVEYVLELDPLDGQYHLFNVETEEFLGDMIENWKRHLDKEGRSAEYDAAEAESIYAMDRMFANGEAKSASYMVSDLSGSVRYANQFVVGEDGHITAQYIDVGKFVRDLSPQEALEVVRNLGERHGFDIRTNAFGYSYLVSQDSSLSVKDIHASVLQKLMEVDGAGVVEKKLTQWERREREHQIASFEQSTIARSVHTIESTLGAAGVKAVSDIRLTLAPIGTLLAAEYYSKKNKTDDDDEEKKKKKLQQEIIQKTGVVEQIKKIFTKHPVTEKEKVRSKPETKLQKAPAVVVFEKKQAEGKKEKISLTEKKKPKINHREIILAVQLLPVASEFGLSHSILRLFAEVEQKKDKRARTNKKRELQPTLRIHTKRSEGTRSKEFVNRKRRKKLVISPERNINLAIKRKHQEIKGTEFKNSSSKPIRKNELQTLRAGQEKKHRSRRKARLSKRVEHNGNIHRRIMTGETKNTPVTREKKLLLVLRKLIKNGNREKQMENRGVSLKLNMERMRRNETLLKAPAHEVSRVKREHERLLSISLILWVLVRSGQKRISHESKRVKPRAVDINTNTSEIRKRSGQIHEFKKAETIEPVGDMSPWLLLAIIWYLAMIREQGMVQSYANDDSGIKNNKKKRRKKRRLTKLKQSYTRKQSSWFPPSGVIYSVHP